MSSPSRQPPAPAPTLSGRLGGFLLAVGAVVGVAMAVLAPGDANPGAVLIALGLVFLVIARLGRPGPHHQDNETPQLSSRSWKTVVCVHPQACGSRRRC